MVSDDVSRVPVSKDRLTKLVEALPSDYYTTHESRVAFAIDGYLNYLRARKSASAVRLDDDSRSRS